MAEGLKVGGVLLESREKEGFCLAGILPQLHERGGQLDHPLLVAGGDSQEAPHQTN